MTARRKRHSPEKIIQKLRDADALLAAGKTIPEVCQALEISEATFHRWREQFAGLEAEEARLYLDGKALDPSAPFPPRRPPCGCVEVWRRGG